MMQGQVAGLSILNGDGSPGSAARLEIRGVPSLTGALAPLIVVDNVPMPSDFDINELNPDDVQSIDILKGASSAAIFFPCSFAYEKAATTSLFCIMLLSAHARLIFTKS